MWVCSHVDHVVIVAESKSSLPCPALILSWCFLDAFVVEQETLKKINK